LLAAEIAIASKLDRTPRFLKEGKRKLEGDSAAPLHLSELCSAIATIELTEGHTRRARQLFRDSLRLPNDNALAQVQWASRKHVGIALTPGDLSQPLGFEARAQTHRSEGRWEPALVEARNWLYDEPFSRHAASFASYLAGLLERYDEAAHLAQIGLDAGPRNPLLLNNLTFALASGGHLDDAQRAFALIPPHEFDSSLRPTLLATQGLLLYRLGNVERGSFLYRQAVEEAKRRNQPFAVVLASLYHAREAAIAGAADALEVWREAEREVEKAKPMPELPLLRSRHDPSSRQS